MKKLISKANISSFFICIFLCLFSIKVFAIDLGDELEVVSDTANLRSEAKADSPKIASITGKTIVKYISQSVDESGEIWYQVELPDGSAGYIRSDFLAEVTKDEKISENKKHSNNKTLIPVDTENEPEGVSEFSEVYVSINDSEVPAWIKDSYFIFYAKQEDSEPAWYIYDKNFGTYIRYHSFIGKDRYLSCDTSSAKKSFGNSDSLIGLNCETELKKIPNGFSEAVIDYNGTKVKAWTKDNYVIFLAQGTAGDINWYLLDTDYQNYIPYRAYVGDIESIYAHDYIEEDNNDDIESIDTDDHIEEDNNDATIENEKEEMNISLLICLLSAIIFLFIVGVVLIIVIVSKNKRLNDANYKYKEIMKYKELLDKGAITQEEFDDFKKKLM